MKKLLVLTTFLSFLASGCIIEPPEDASLALNEAQGNETGGEVEIFTNLNLLLEWQYACETRAGNMLADALAGSTGVDIAFINGGSVREDSGVDYVPAGMLQRYKVAQIVPFSNDMLIIEVRAWRLKQILETSLSLLGTEISSPAENDYDEYGAQHGNCFYDAVTTGSNGRFYHSSSALRYSGNLSGTAQKISTPDTGDSFSSYISQDGTRITRIEINDIVYYENSNGDPDDGWESGTESCTIERPAGSTPFSSSRACDKLTILVNSFHFIGSEDYIMFNRKFAEVSSDDSISYPNPTTSPDPDLYPSPSPASEGKDIDLIWEDLMIQDTVSPEIEGRSDLFKQ